MITLKLSPDWDLEVDNFGNIATVDGQKQISQDVACACRVFKGENPWDITSGIPYKENIFGARPNLSVLQAYATQEALKVPGANTIDVVINGFDKRTLKPEIIINNREG